jgi:putative phage-type endonuclease
MTPDEMIALRRSGIGGSDAAACANLSRWRSRHDVWLEKMGLSAPLIETEAMEWGKILEPVLLRKYTAETGREVIVLRDKSGEQRTLRHPKYEWMMCHTDGRTRRKPFRGLEVKTTNPFDLSDWGEPGTDQVPVDYHLQCQHDMAVTGWDVFDMPVLIGGQRYRRYTVERDNALIDQIIEVESDLWDRVQRNDPPAVDGSDASTRFLATRFPTDDGTAIEATEEQAELVRRLLVAEAEEKEADARITLLKNTIKESMGSVTVVDGPTFRVTWKATAGTTQWKGVAESLRVSVESAAWQTAVASAQTAGSRRFTVTERQ